MGNAALYLIWKGQMIKIKEITGKELTTKDEVNKWIVDEWQRK